MSLVQHVLVLLARVLLGMFFLWSGANQIIIFWVDSVAQLAQKGLPNPEAMLALAVAAMLIGGLSLVLGLRARWGAVVLILFLLAATALTHDFWNEDPTTPEYVSQAIHCLKNLGLVGGLCMVLAFGPGGFSADTFLRKRPNPN